MLKKKQCHIKVIARLIIFFLIAGFIYFGYSQYQYSKLSDEEAIRKEFEKVMKPLEKELLPEERLVILNIDVEDNWATVEYGGQYTDTGKAVPVGPGLIILKKTYGSWKGALPGTQTYKTWLDEAPENVIPTDLKILLR